MILCSLVILTAGILIAQDYRKVDEKPCDENADVCVPPGQSEEENDEAAVAERDRCCRCRTRYNPYWNRDEDATWPGKNTDAFYDSFMK